MLATQNLGKIIKNVNFDKNPRYEPGTFKVWDQHATTAIYFGLGHNAKKLVFINGAYIFVKRVEPSGSGVEQKSGILRLFNLSNFELLGFQILMI